ncbi:MAG: hypothetical protein JWP25_9001 [Bradyrhizobium sp.]|nr:hypothetical protein [Bradyrhizobium sp.]
MADLELTTVPRDLYYHEVAYVRDLEVDLKQARTDAELWKSRWEAERADHEATIKHADKAIDDAVNGY